MPNNLQLRARLIGGLILLLLGGWVLHGFLALLAWAVVLAISTWPIYQRLLASNELHGKITWVAVALTLLIGAFILAPLGYGLSRLLHEAQSLGQLLTHAQNVGIPPPVWLDNPANHRSLGQRKLDERCWAVQKRQMNPCNG